MSTMQEMFPDMGNENTDGSSMESILMGMLSPEQKAMFDAFSSQT